jgi:hypothetical protein
MGRERGRRGATRATLAVTPTMFPRLTHAFVVLFDFDFHFDFDFDFDWRWRR